MRLRITTCYDRVQNVPREPVADIVFDAAAPNRGWASWETWFTFSSAHSILAASCLSPFARESGSGGPGQGNRVVTTQMPVQGGPQPLE